MRPEVSIIIPVLNSEKYIRQCIESIICQTYTKWELIIIDGGSTDNTASIVSSFNNERIRYLSTSKFLNILEATEKGVRVSKGKYIAFIDSDNVMHKNRLLIQTSYLKSHPKFALIGTWYRQINNKGNKSHRVYAPFINYDLIKIKMLFGNCVVQPTVTIRKEIFNKYRYNHNLNEAADYDLWMRVSKDYPVENLPLVLTYYRVHEGNESSKINIKKKMIIANKVILNNLFKQLNIPVNNQDVLLHLGLEKRDRVSIEELDKYEVWLNKLKLFNKKKHIYNEDSFNYLIACYWFRICSISAENGFVALKKYTDSQLSSKILKEKILLSILCTTKMNYAFESYSHTWKQIILNSSIKSYIRFFLISIPSFILGLFIRKTMQE